MYILLSWLALLTGTFAADIAYYVGTGLGIERVRATATASSTDSSTTTTETIQVVVTVTAPTSPPALADSSSTSTSTDFVTVTISNDTDPAAQDCQASLVSWNDAYSAHLLPTTWYNSSINYTTISETYVKGTADVYTTQDGIPRAHGTYTFFENITWSTTITSTVTQTNTFLLDPSFTNRSPNCTIAPSACSVMYGDYRSSLGLAFNSSIPVITPAPTNSPRCPDIIGEVIAEGYTYYSGGEGMCFGRVETQHPCELYGRSVQLLYWPQATTAPGEPAKRAQFATNASTPITTIWRNHTLTYPSAYIAISSIAANIYTFGDELCFSDGAAVLLGDQALTQVKPATNVVMAFDPTEISSVMLSLSSGVDYASAANDMAKGGKDYSKYAGMIYNTLDNNYTYASIDYNAIEHPSPEAYYFNLNPPQGCLQYGPHPECSTIIEGQYRAGLQVPSRLRAMHPEWATCVDALHGLYDPPIKLPKVSTIAGPSLTAPNAVSTEQPASPASTFAPITPQPTAIPEVTTADPVSSNGGIPGPSRPSDGGGEPASTPIDPASTSQAAPSPDPATTMGDPNPQTSQSYTKDLADPVEGSVTSTGNPNANPQTTTTGTLNALSILQSALSSAHDPVAPSWTWQDGSASTPVDPAPATTVVGSYTYTAQPAASSGVAIVNDVTLKAGDPGTVIGSQTVSAVSDGVVIGTQTVIAATPSTAGGSFATSASVSIALSDGGDPQVIGGQTLSAASDGIVVGSSTYAFGAATGSGGGALSSAVVFAAGGWTFTASQGTASNVIVVGGQPTGASQSGTGTTSGSGTGAMSAGLSSASGETGAATVGAATSSAASSGGHALRIPSAVHLLALLLTFACATFI